MAKKRGRKKGNGPKYDQCCGQSAWTIDSRPSNQGYRIRRRKCITCGRRFSTVEIGVEEFDRLRKCEADLQKARDVFEKLTER